MWKTLGIIIIIIGITCIGISLGIDIAYTKQKQQIDSIEQQIEFMEQFLVIKEQPIEKVRTMRVTGYTPTGKKTALGDKVVIGKTAAVSRNCMDLLGEYVYIEGLGVRYVHDLTAKWVGDKFNMCTIDVAVPTKKDTYKIGNRNRTVVHIR